MSINQNYLAFFVTTVGLICSSCSVSKTAVTQTQSSTQLSPVATTNLPLQDTPKSTFPFQTDLSCWQTKSLQAGSNIKGSLVFEYDGAGYFYWDVSSFSGKFLTNESIFAPPLLSPDGTYMLIELNNHEVALMFSDHSSVTFNLPLTENGYNLTYLLNGKILAAPNAWTPSDPISNKNYQEEVGYTVSYYIYDPETGSLTSHSVLLPNFEFFHYSGVYVAYIAYSPDGKYVLYRSSLPKQEKKYGFSLLDLQSNQIKWIVPEEENKALGMGEPIAFMPIWKPDASALTYIWDSNNESKDQNYYNISLSGVIAQFTHFEDILPHGYILYSRPKWSPDMRYLAFEIDEPSHPREPELFIWDDVNKTLLNPCIYTVGLYGWSFDSNHIALGFPLPTPVILDIPNKVIYELPNVHDMREYLKLTGNDSFYSVDNWLNWEIP